MRAATAEDGKNAFGALVRQYRTAAGLTQRALAEQANLSRRRVADLERGARGAPHPSTMLCSKLATALGLSDLERSNLVAAARRTRMSDRSRTPPGARANRLPVALTSFVGRAAQLAEVRGLCRTTRLVTLVGPPGIGKTRLSLEVAHSIAKEDDSAVAFVELAAVSDGTLVPNAIAAALHIREQPRRAMSDTLLDALAARALLLVVDNCEHMIDPCARLLERLLQSCPDLRVLATSREPLGIPGETTRPVAPLALPGRDTPATDADLADNEAVKLFVERASLVAPGFCLLEGNAWAIIDICRRLDGIPLAIELAASRTPALDVHQIAARLDDRFSLLTYGTRTAPARHRTLQAAVDSSYELLDESERRVFERLCVFANGCRLEAAEYVCATSQTAAQPVLHTLTRLVDKSLVVVDRQEDGSTRYRLLETLRDYGRERLEDRGTGHAAETQHAAFFLTLAEQAEPELLGPRQALWLRRLQVEHDDLRLALTRSLAQGATETALRLAGALVRFWFSLGYLTEGRAWLARVLPRASDSDPPAVRARLLYGSALLAQFQGDYAAVEDPIRQAVVLWREAENPAEVAQSLYVLGTWHWMRGQRAEARHQLLESLDVACAVEHPVVQGLVLRGLADLAFEDGDDALARAHAHEALGIARGIGWTRTISQALRILGEISFREGDWKTARGHFEASIAAAREMGDGFWVASALPRLGHLVLDQGETLYAWSLFVEALATFRDLGDRWGVARCLEGCACLAVAQREFRSAVVLAAAAATMRQAMHAPPSPPEQVTLERWLAPAHARLPAAEVAAARAAGAHMSVEQTMEVAVSLRPTAGMKRVADAQAMLSAREVQVAELVAAGFSNREISGRLVITPGTATLHVKHILSKLGFRSRSQIAAWMSARAAAGAGEHIPA